MKLFPIFNEVPIRDAAITFSEDTPFHFGIGYIDNYIGILIEFRYSNRKEVINWFQKSEYEKYDLFELNAGTYILYFRISDLIDH